MSGLGQNSAQRPGVLVGDAGHRTRPLEATIRRAMAATWAGFSRRRRSPRAILAEFAVKVHGGEPEIGDQRRLERTKHGIAGDIAAHQAVESWEASAGDTVQRRFVASRVARICTQRQKGEGSVQCSVFSVPSLRTEN